jgi:murein L,D-transpeptidase YafK
MAGVLLFLVAGACARLEHLPPPRVPEAPSPDRAEERPCERIEWIQVLKAERALVAHCIGGGRRRFTAALGREPGPKLRAGDQRTPEGRYRITSRARPSRFHLFIPIDYPNEEDAARALAEGVLSREWYERIVRARSRGAPPPTRSPLGTGLGLHGEGPRWRGDSAGLDWTEGCIGLADRDIDFIAHRVRIGTPVIVSP